MLRLKAVLFSYKFELHSKFSTRKGEGQTRKDKDTNSIKKYIATKILLSKITLQTEICQFYTPINFYSCFGQPSSAVQSPSYSNRAHKILLLQIILLFSHLCQITPLTLRQAQKWARKDHKSAVLLVQKLAYQKQRRKCC